MNLTAPAPTDKSTLALFMTSGLSLSAWQRVGILERELALYERLAQEGWNTTVVSYGGPEEQAYARSRPWLTVLANRWRLPMCLYVALLPRLHAAALAKADLFKTNQTSAGAAALRATHRLRKPLVARCGFMWSDHARREHGSGSPHHRAALDAEQELFSSAQAVVVTAEAMRGDVLSRVADASVRVIPNYVRTDLFRPLDGNKRFDFLFIGRLAEQKNVLAMVEAVAGLDATLHMVGEGPLGTTISERFGDLDGRLSISPPVPHGELPVLMSRARAYLQPSLYEGHPKTILEAMACGLPVVGANTPGTREVIRHEETGLLCETDADSIRAACRRLLDDHGHAADLGAAAHEQVLKHCSLDAVVEKELETYEDALSAGTLKS